jgi:opacity protein-like surface antigen
MRNIPYVFCLLTAMLSTISHAALPLHPVLAIGWGSDTTDVNVSQNITLLAPFQNTYYAHTNDTQTVANVFLGAELPFLNKWAWQLGAAYFQNITPFNPTGTVYQFADLDYGNLTYNFNVQSRRYLIQTKLLYAITNTIHPYLLAGAGEAINRSYSYSEIPVSSADVPMQATFANKTVHAFTYTFGLGFELDLTDHLRYGFGYNYVNLGHAGLGVIPDQDSTDTIKLNNLNTSEFMMQLSYVG